MVGRDGAPDFGIGLDCMQCREQPGAAGAEDQNVGFEMLDGHELFLEHAHQKSEGDDGGERGR